MELKYLKLIVNKAEELGITDVHVHRNRNLNRACTDKEPIYYVSGKNDKSETMDLRILADGTAIMFRTLAAEEIKF